MEDREERMENGEWKIEDERWRMENRGLSGEDQDKGHAIVPSSFYPPSFYPLSSLRDPEHLLHLLLN
jgi:hypothetical protein